MKKKILLIPLALLLAMSLVAISCAAPAPEKAAPEKPAAAPIKLSMTCSLTIVPEGDQCDLLEFEKRVNEAAGGRLIVEVLGGPEVISAKDQPEALRTGVLDMGSLAGVRLRAYAPEFTILGVSRISKEEEIDVGFVDHMRELGIKNCNMYLLGMTGSNTNITFMTNKKVSRPQELAGQRMCLTQWVIPQCEAIGMKPIPVEVVDFYSAFGRGLCEAGYSGSYRSFCDSSYEEVMKYFIDHPFMKNNFIYMVNLDVWNSLPKDLQDLLQKVQRDTMEWNWDFTTEYHWGGPWREKMEKAGVEFIKFTPEDEAWYLGRIYESKWVDVKDEITPESYKYLRDTIDLPGWEEREAESLSR